MSTPFSQTLRSLDRRHDRGLYWSLGIVLLLLAAWGVWIVAGELTVHATGAARLETDRRPHRVAGVAGGQVTAVPVVLGERVTAGQPLVVLDDVEVRVALAEVEAERAAAERTAAVLEQQIVSEQSRLQKLRRQVGAATDEERFRERQAIAELEDAEAEVERLRPLVDLGILGRAELERAEGRVNQLGPAAQAQGSAVDRREGESGVDLAAAQVRLDSLQAELERERGTLALAEARLERLHHELEHYLLPSPVDGVVGQLADLRPGDVIAAGQTVAQVVPAGDMRIIAEFEPSVAAGRIRPGLAASMSFDGFPWTQFGRLRATVTVIGSEPRDGRIRVELVPDPSSAPEIPLQHGLPGTVEVAVEHPSPLELMLRLAGRRAAGAPAAGAPTEAANP